jgi:hypothetical protein
MSRPVSGTAYARQQPAWQVAQGLAEAGDSTTGRLEADDAFVMKALSEWLLQVFPMKIRKRPLASEFQKSEQLTLPCGRD